MSEMNDNDFEQLLETVLKAPASPAGLEQKLLAIPALVAAADLQAVPASNDSFWRRALPVAACLGLFLLLAQWFQPQSEGELQAEILAHVYAEERFLASEGHVSLQDVNSRMQERLGARLESSPDTEAMNVVFAKDCFLAKKLSVHMIVDGDTGPVSLMMIPARVVARETTISDARFSGTITPVAGGTLVVLGNPQEPVGKYFDLINDHVRWEY